MSRGAITRTTLLGNWRGSNARIYTFQDVKNGLQGNVRSCLIDVNCCGSHNNNIAIMEEVMVPSLTKRMFT